MKNMLVGLLLAVSLVMVSADKVNNSNVKFSITPGEPAPHFSMADSNGGVKAAGSKTGKAVFLVMLQNDKPSRDVIPFLNDLAKTRADHVTVLGVAWKVSSMDKVKQMKKDLGVEFPMLFDPQNMSARFSVTTAPSGYLITGSRFNLAHYTSFDQKAILADIDKESARIDALHTNCKSVFYIPFIESTKPTVANKLGGKYFDAVHSGFKKAGFVDGPGDKARFVLRGSVAEFPATTGIWINVLDTLVNKTIYNQFLSYPTDEVVKMKSEGFSDALDQLILTTSQICDANKARPVPQNANPAPAPKPEPKKK